LLGRGIKVYVDAG